MFVDRCALDVIWLVESHILLPVVVLLFSRWHDMQAIWKPKMFIFIPRLYHALPAPMLCRLAAAAYMSMIDSLGVRLTRQLPSPVEKMLVTQPIKDQFRVAALLVDHLARVFPGDCAGFSWMEIETEWFDQISMKVTNTQLGSDDGFGVGVCDTFNL